MRVNVSHSVVGLYTAATATAAAVAVCLLLAGCPRDTNNGEIVITITDESAGQGTQATTPDEILQAARSEGELTWYTSMPQEQADELAGMFEKAYPFVRVRIVRQGTFEIVRRVQEEAASGQRGADVVHVLDPGIFISLRKSGQLYKYEPTESKAIPPGYKDAGYWTTARLVTVCIAVKTGAIPQQDLPTTWRDLLDPKWRGEMAIKDAQTGGSAYAQYYFLREKYGVSYWEQFAQQRPLIYKSEDRGLEALVHGDVKIAAGALGYKVYQAARIDGQPIEAIWPTDGVPVCLGPIAILRSCPHPNAAKLFVEYVLSKEGQGAITRLLGSYSMRPDVAAPEGRVALSELSLFAAPDGWQEYLEKQNELQREYGALFNPESE